MNGNSTKSGKHSPPPAPAVFTASRPGIKPAAGAAPHKGPVAAVPVVFHPQRTLFPPAALVQAKQAAPGALGPASRPPVAVPAVFRPPAKVTPLVQAKLAPGGPWPRPFAQVAPPSPFRPPAQLAPPQPFRPPAPAASATLVQRSTTGKATGKATLAKVKSKIDVDSADSAILRRLSRIIRLNRARNPTYTDKNKFGATVLAEGVKITFHLDSKGMGKKGELHPKINGFSAAHTEKMWWGLYMHHHKSLRAQINKKLAKRGKVLLGATSPIKVISIVSTNAPCSSIRKSDHAETGCSGIHTANMGMGEDIPMYYGNNYPADDSYLSEYQLATSAEKKLRDKKMTKDADSTDDELDTDEFRGMNMDKPGLVVRSRS